MIKRIRSYMEFTADKMDTYMDLYTEATRINKETNMEERTTNQKNIMEEATHNQEIGSTNKKNITDVMAEEPTRLNEGPLILWHFLLFVLMQPNFEQYIRWLGDKLKFILVDPSVVFAELVQQKKEGEAPTLDIDPKTRWAHCLASEKIVKDRLRGLRSEYYLDRKDSKPYTPFIVKAAGKGCYEFLPHDAIWSHLNMSYDDLVKYAESVAAKYPRIVTATVPKSGTRKRRRTTSMEMIEPPCSIKTSTIQVEELRCSPGDQNNVPSPPIWSPQQPLWIDTSPYQQLPVSSPEGSSCDYHSQDKIKDVSGASAVSNNPQCLPYVNYLPELNDPAPANHFSNGTPHIPDYHTKTAENGPIQNQIFWGSSMSLVSDSSNYNFPNPASLGSNVAAPIHCLSNYLNENHTNPEYISNDGIYVETAAHVNQWSLEPTATNGQTYKDQGAMMHLPPIDARALEECVRPVTAVVAEHDNEHGSNCALPALPHIEEIFPWRDSDNTDFYTTYNDPRSYYDSFGNYRGYLE